MHPMRPQGRLPSHLRQLSTATAALFGYSEALDLHIPQASYGNTKAYSILRHASFLVQFHRKCNGGYNAPAGVVLGKRIKDAWSPAFVSPPRLQFQKETRLQ